MSKAPSDNQYFGTEKTMKILFKLAPPVMLAQLIQSLYNIVDSFFIGKFSGYALTALSVIYPMQLLICAVAVGTGVGVNTVMARFYGQKRTSKAINTAGIGTVMAVVSWFIFALISFFIIKPYALISAESEIVHEYTIMYGRIIGIFSLGIFLESTWTKILQSQGDMKTPMIAQIVGALTNIILDPILIFGMFGIKPMGVAGAAVATVCGQLVTLLFCLYFHLKKEHRIPLSYLKPDHYWKSIIKIGISPFGLTYLPAVTILFMNLQTLKYGGTEAVSAYAVLAYVLSFLELVIQGISDGSQPLLSYDCGKKDYRSLRTYARWTFLLAFSFGIVGGTFIYLFRDVIPVIYGTSKATAMVIAQAAPAFGIVMLMYGFTKSTVSYLYATNRTTLSSIMVYGEVVLTITFIFVLPLFLGLNGVWYTMPTVQLILVIVGIVFRLHTQKELSANA